MQKLFILLVAALLLMAFAPAKDLDAIIAALNSGNAAALARHADEQVEVGLPGNTGTYSRAQATSRLKDFFAGSGVRSFELKHKGDQGGKAFCIGVLHTRRGSYRTQVFLHTKDGRQVIRLISFQAQ